MKLRFIVLVFVFCSLLLFTSVSYCALSANTFTELKDNLMSLKDAGVLPSTFSTQYITNGEYFRSDRYTILITSNYLYLFGCHANSNLITNYNVSSSNAKYNDWCQDDGTQYPYTCGCYRYNLNGANGQSGTFPLNSETFVYAYTLTEIDTRSLTLEAGGEFGRSVLNNSLRFTPFDNNIQTISNIPLHIENFSRSVVSWRLGTLENFDIYTKGYIDIFNGSNWNNIGQLSWNSNGEVYIDNSRLLYYQAYRIYFHDYDYNYTDNFGYYFLPIGVTLSSGDSLVYNGNDNNTSQPIISAINGIYQFNSGEINNSFTNYFGSGDKILATINDSYISSGDNHYYNFIYETFNSIINTLRSSGNVTLNIDYRDFHMVLNSSDYYIPDNNPFKIFMRISLITGFIFLIYQQLDKIIRHINNLQIEKMLHDTDVDYDIYL